MRRIDSSAERGFTLIEIAVAIAILGTALVTLVGLQSRTLNSYLQDKYRTRATLAGQYLMTVWEAKQQFKNIGEKEGDLETGLRDVGFFDTDASVIDPKTFAGWRYKRTIAEADLSKIQLGGIDPSLLKGLFRRVDVSVTWGPAFGQEFALTYFIKSPTTAQGLQNATQN